MKKLKLDLKLVLPPDAAQADPCVERLLGALRERPGVVDAHVEQQPGAQAILCVHFSPEVLAPSTVESLVRAVGVELASKYGHIDVPVTGVRHERHARTLAAVLASKSGVLYATVSFGTKHAAIEFDPSKVNEREVLGYLKDAGLYAGGSPVAHPGHTHRPGEGVHAHDEHDHSPEKSDDPGAHTPAPAGEHAHGPGEHAHAHGGPFGERSELIFSLICGALTGAGWLCDYLDVARVPLVLYILAYLFGGWFTLQEAIGSIRAKRFEIDFLMLVAAGGAAALGELFEGALLLFLFSLGHALEAFAMARARNAIAALSKLAPKTALRVDSEGRETVIPIDQLALGDRVVVKPNTQIPADGIVIRGESSVNQAPITGESVPVDKRPHPNPSVESAPGARIAPEHQAFAGTINGSGPLEILVTRIAAESTLARVIQMVTQADTQKSPTQRFTDRFERIFVPVVLGLVGLLLLAWLVINEPFSASFYRAMAVLVAASPCALAIATPSAILSGVARAARGGVLFKGGAHIESLGSIEAMAFDKTGTLTEGKPRLVAIAPLPGTSNERLLSVAVAVERRSDHPLASAIVIGGTPHLTGEGPEAEAVESITGFGIRARVAGEEVVVGKIGLFTRDGGVVPAEVRQAVEEQEQAGRTVVVVQAGGAFLGVLGVMDTPRPSAKPVLARLRELGITRSIMLTGDNQRVADAVAREVGLTEARGDLLPEQKVAAIAELAHSGARVAMVGDGVNDAPAMASATVGVTMGAGGSDVALETADVALMSDDLSGLPFAVGLSRACRRIIRQNLWASLGMVAFLIPATILGFAGIGLAVALHEGSTLLVVGNALRLLAFRDERSAS